MSSPESRLVSDDVAEGLLEDAETILSAGLAFDSTMRVLAIVILALLRDRGARQELAVTYAKHRSETVTRCEEDR